jgi:hypothetical protein
VTGATIPEGSVVITPTEMYREMVDTHRAVQNISTKLDGALSDNSRRLDGIDKDLVDHETRLRGLERRVWMAVGVSTAVSGGAAALISQLVAKH